MPMHTAYTMPSMASSKSSQLRSMSHSMSSFIDSSGIAAPTKALNTPRTNGSTAKMPYPELYTSPSSAIANGTARKAENRP